MKNVSKVVALILSASAGVWMTGCAAEMGNSSEEADFALANVEHGGISKGKGLAPTDISASTKEKKGTMGGQGGQLNENVPVAGGISGEIDSPILGKGNLGKGNIEKGLGKGARIPAGTTQDVEQPAVDQNPAIDQSADDEKVDDSQAAGGDSQIDDEADVDQDEATEGETGESQEALSDQWRGRGGWGGRHGGYGRFGGYGGYGRFGGYGRHRFGGYGYGRYHGFPRYGYGHRGYYGGYYGYPYYGGYGYYPGAYYPGYGVSFREYCLFSWRGRRDPRCYAYFW